MSSQVFDFRFSARPRDFWLYWRLILYEARDYSSISLRRPASLSRIARNSPAVLRAASATAFPGTRDVKVSAIYIDPLRPTTAKIIIYPCRRTSGTPIKNEYSVCLGDPGQAPAVPRRLSREFFIPGGGVSL